MPTTAIDGITTRYEVIGSDPPLLMYAPGGFDATLEKWSALGVYARADYWDIAVAEQTEATAAPRILDFLARNA
jgi:hypothetical protein